jgi:hypothetical protein
MLHIHLSSGAGTWDQLVADVPSWLCLTPPHENKKKLFTSNKVAPTCQPISWRTQKWQPQRARQV